MTIVFFGDSICTGQRVSIHNGWVVKISRALFKEHPNTIVTNSSVNGRTTRQALETMPYEIQSAPPEILIIQFGMNDCNYWETDKGVPRVSKNSFCANLEEIIERALKFGVDKIFVNTNHITGLNNKLPYTEITYQQNNEDYNNLIRKTCEKLNIEVNDVEAVFKKQDNVLDFLLPDLLHLNHRGHNLYCDAIYPVLKRAVDERN
jgi:lysophospholipase L1-like esterase